MARKTLSLTPLFAPLPRDFQVGEPANGRHPHCPPTVRCRVPGVDYSGADPLVQWPSGIHVTAGEGGAMGGYHQSPECFEPWRVAVVPDPNPRRKRNVLHCTGGAPGKPGKYMLADWFRDPDTGELCDVAWEDREAVRLKFAFMPTGTVPHYLNVECRGLLNVRVRKNEPGECLGLYFTDRQIMVAYWRDAVDGSRVDEKRAQHKIPVALQPDRWHRLDVQLRPTRQLDTWKVAATLRVQQKLVWTFTTRVGNHPNNIRAINHLAYGDEPQRDERGGECYIARPMCWAISGGHSGA